jgi:hypothetical protein
MGKDFWEMLTTKVNIYVTLALKPGNYKKKNIIFYPNITCPQIRYTPQILTALFKENLLGTILKMKN